MFQFAQTWRVLAGGLAAGAIGVTAFAGGTASADPSPPAPPPAIPGVPAVLPPASLPPIQNVTAVPGGITTNNRFVATPQAPGPAALGPTPPTVAAPVAGTLRDYFKAKDVKLVAQKPQGFKALDITLPVPTRWTQVPDPNVPDAFAVIADRLGNSLYTSNAQVVVYQLVGNFDPKEAITHGFVDAQQLFAWQTTNASQADFEGFPSSIIEGTYRENDMTLNTSRRHVIASSGPDKYLVSLSVTTALSQAVADAPATNAISNGFRVSAPTASAPAPTQRPGSTPVGLTGPAPLPGMPPGQPPAPNLLSLVPGLLPLPNLMLTPSH
ncbi:LpqN/LpqT family lipoprotein [Mycobacterium haemophilum]|uniref:Proline-rich antigen n=1 Tax=Mycobacterium haemophilum TaxID=29311 RepID=A0A0I9U080_9MYCO|nr:LpqN/LpqT family lipoprotein [Mycobacterium haemophilum]KLO28671.1 proline-rich antigen [Mycobacterium haemophilum]KLO35479.1 proline-rich antigen [Mycobacterium haemophilum]KLO40714.1 proline-rich antigen [Mycobacterium haemophilum]KLO48170.1 proline-rich antigen [Mycobacterium haemophilum]